MKIIVSVRSLLLLTSVIILFSCTSEKDKKLSELRKKFKTDSLEIETILKKNFTKVDAGYIPNEFTSLNFVKGISPRTKGELFLYQDSIPRLIAYLDNEKVPTLEIHQAFWTEYDVSVEDFFTFPGINHESAKEWMPWIPCTSCAGTQKIILKDTVIDNDRKSLILVIGVFKNNIEVTGVNHSDVTLENFLAQSLELKNIYISFGGLGNYKGKDIKVGIKEKKNILLVAKLSMLFNNIEILKHEINELSNS